MYSNCAISSLGSNGRNQNCRHWGRNLHKYEKSLECTNPFAKQYEALFFKVDNAVADPFEGLVLWDMSYMFCVRWDPLHRLLLAERWNIAVCFLNTDCDHFFIPPPGDLVQIGVRLFLFLSGGQAPVYFCERRAKTTRKLQGPPICILLLDSLRDLNG